MLKDSARVQQREQIINIGCKSSDFAEFHIEDSAMGQVKSKSKNYGCK